MANRWQLNIHSPQNARGRLQRIRLRCGEGIFRGEGGQGVNRFSIFEVLRSRGTGGYAIWCSSGRLKLSKSKGLKGENVSIS